MMYPKGHWVTWRNKRAIRIISQDIDGDDEETTEEQDHLRDEAIEGLVAPTLTPPGDPSTRKSFLATKAMAESTQTRCVSTINTRAKGQVEIDNQEHKQ